MDYAESVMRENDSSQLFSRYRALLTIGVVLLVLGIVAIAFQGVSQLWLLLAPVGIILSSFSWRSRFKRLWRQPGRSTQENEPAVAPSAGLAAVTRLKIHSHHDPAKCRGARGRREGRTSCLGGYAGIP